MWLRLLRFSTAFFFFFFGTHRMSTSGSALRECVAYTVQHTCMHCTNNNLCFRNETTRDGRRAKAATAELYLQFTYLFCTYVRYTKHTHHWSLTEKSIEFLPSERTRCTAIAFFLILIWIRRTGRNEADRRRQCTQKDYLNAYLIGYHRRYNKCANVDWVHAAEWAWKCGKCKLDDRTTNQWEALTRTISHTLTYVYFNETFSRS